MWGIQLCIPNQQDLLSHYVFNMWESMLKFKYLLPQESRQEFSSLIEEGKTVARASLRAALDVSDSVARSMAIAVIMHRSLWLQSLGFPHEMQQTLQNLPFEGSLLFSEQTDTTFHGLKDSMMTLKYLNLWQSPENATDPNRLADTLHSQPGKINRGGRTLSSWFLR